MHIKIYRCKLCKEVVKEKVYGETDQSIRIKLINYYIKEKKIHFCSNNKTGVLEIIGIEKD